MNRRKFVWVSSLSCLALLLPMSSCSGNDLERSLALPISLSYIFDKETIQKIGKLYLIKKWRDTKKKHIKELLLKDIDISNSLSDFSFVSDEIQKKIIKDFASNKTVEIDGWILSETEAQQCAFFSIINT